MPEALLRLEGTNSCTGLFDGCNLPDKNAAVYLFH